MGNIRGLVEDFRTAGREDQAVTPIVGAIAGVALAFAIERYGPEPDPANFTITTSQARASLLSALALVFTGLSIVLALTALAAGNMASKFSPRLLRMRLSGGGNKWVLGAFALTAAYIIASQILLRGRESDSLAPPLMMSVSVVLLILTGVMIVWYINGTLQSMRVDRAIRWIGRRILRSMVAQEHARRHDDIQSEIDLEQPGDAVELTAPDDGYLVDVDTGQLHRIAAESDAVRHDLHQDRRPRRRGRGHRPRMGTFAARTPRSRRHRRIAHRRPDARSTRHRLLGRRARRDRTDGVVSRRERPEDRGRMHREADGVWAAMSQVEFGPRTRSRDDGSYTVVVHENTMGDFMDTAGRQILLYGGDDRSVTAALRGWPARRSAPPGTSVTETRPSLGHRCRSRSGRRSVPGRSW